MFKKATSQSEAAVKASYIVAAEIAKSARPFNEGEFGKKCMMKVCDLVCPEKKQAFSNMSLSRNTVADRTCDLATNLYDQLMEKGKDFVAFSLAVDDTDTAQLSVFIRRVDSNLCVTEELLGFKSMHGTTTGKEMFEEVSKCVIEIKLPWDKLVGLATDGAPAMCGKKSGLVGMVREKMREENCAVECQHNIKSHLMQKFRRVFEGIAKAGQSTDLNDFYTELFITERVSGEVNKEHEVSLIETASRKPAKEETPIKLEDFFKPLPGQDQPSRTIMTTGVAGIGKTILTHKFTLDWAEGKANHDIHFTLPFTFRELNLLKEKEFSLMDLLHHFFIQTKGIQRYDLFQVVFILDGLDECRLPLDFKNNPIWTDVTKSTSVDVLLTNLIRGDLLPSARIWITTRPAAANQIPAECVGMVTEVRGFTDPQKEKYFRKRFREETLASTIISHIKTSRSLHIMCHIP
ncbi:hypothetical protein NHX12_000606, partial [Muraenolepis orangiensis]